MSVSALSPSEIAVLTPLTVEVDRAMLVLKRQRETEKAQAQALVSLITQAGDIGRRINVYA